jgi:hypothetical protein
LTINEQKTGGKTMIELLQALALIGLGGVLCLSGVFLGAFIVHRAKSTIPGTGFITGSVPKGEVFTMKDELDSLSEDGAEKKVLAKNRIFNHIFGKNIKEET